MMNRLSLRRAALTTMVTMLTVSGVGIPRTVGVASAAEPESGITFVVDTTSDENDNQLNDDLCITSAGGCSLRAAILQANATEGPNRIEFDIPGTGPHTIVLSSQLPTISDLSGPLVIDGYTQPGASENTDPQASNANIQIGITSATYVNGGAAVVISSADNVVRGLAVYNAYFPVLVFGTSALRNHIVGNFIGTNPEATFYIPWGWSNAAGVQLDLGASFNRIGTPALADRNVISGNKSWGIRIEQNETRGNYVQNNIVGLNPSGTDRLPQQGGIDVQWGTRDNIVGGRAENEHNVFSGLQYAGIDFSHESFNNQAIGNYIGTDLTGKQAFPWTQNQFGLLIKDDARLNYYEANVVVNQRQEGVYNKHNYTGANTFVNNLIGLSLDGSPYGNSREGIQLRGHDDVFERNIIANNGQDGVYLDSGNGSGPNDDELTERNRLTANSFWNNGQDGIDINGSTTQANLAAPVLASSIPGTTSGTACAGCEVEIYLADAVASSPQGRQYLGTAIADVTSGSFSFSDARIEAGRPITALAIDQLDNTSQFAATVTSGGAFTIQNGASGLCLEVQSGSVSNGANIQLFTCDLSAGQYWELVAAANGFALRNPASGKCIDVGGVSQTDGANVVLWTCNGGANQTLVETNQALAFQHSGMCLDVDGDPNVVGANVVQSVCDASAVQTFSGQFGPQAVLPSVTTPGDLTLTRTTATSIPVTATPAGVTFTALRLPNGLTIDPDTGIISGTPERAGRFPITILAHNADGIHAVDAMWTVEFEPLPPVVDTIDDLVSDIDIALSLQVVANDPNNDVLTYSATGLPTGVTIDPVTGSMSGTPTEGGDFTATVTVSDGTTPVPVSFLWSVDPGFVCQVDGSTLSWSDEGATNYHVRHLTGGTDTYLSKVTGTLQYTVASQFGVYKIIAYTPDRIETTCDAPLGEPDPFTCTVTGDTLSWTNQGANNYHIRHLLSGGETYVASVSGSGTLDYTVASQFGVYKIIAYTPDRIETTCDAPLGEPDPFTCTVTGNVVSWTNQGANNYYIRHLLSGDDIYVASVSGSGTLDYTVASQFGAYKVIAYTPDRIETTCDAPLGAPVAFTCTVTGDTLSWTNQGVSTYYMRQQVSGADQFIGSSTGLSYVLDNSFGTFEVRYNLNGDTFSTSCDGVLLPEFTCSVDTTGLLTWTDQQSGSYFVRRVLAGQDQFVGSSSGLTFQLADTAGDFRVLYNRSGSQYTAACPLV